MRLVSYNIQYGFGSDGRYDLGRIARAVDGADIIALQEVERFWNRSNLDDQPDMLMRLLPGYHAVYGPAFDMDASRRDGGHVINRRRQFGTMLLSKLPIDWSRLHSLPMRRMADPLNTRNAALECLIRTPIGPVRFVSLHLAHVGVAERLAQIDYLLGQHDGAVREGGPWSGRDDEPDRDWTNAQPEPESSARAVWLGDFNCEAGSQEHARLCDQTPYHPGARYHGGFCDATAMAGVERGSLYTHVKVIAGELRKRQLDHCFVTGEIAARVRSVHAATDQTGSDHFPLWVEIDLETMP